MSSDNFTTWQPRFNDPVLSTRIAFSVPAAVLIFVLFTYLRGLYRVYLHPLSNFPGPREAAKSHSWLYQQTQKDYPEDIYEQIHHKYDAKAIRIAPNELHITDTNLYKVIYRQSNPFPKNEPFYLAFNAPSPTVFTEMDEAKHKERRRMLNPMFSRAGVLKLEDLIRERLALLESKIERLREKQNIDFYDAFRQPHSFDRSAVNHPIVLENLTSLSDVALVGESLDLLVAGSDTSATSVTTALFEILRNPAIEKRLVEELDAAIPDKNDLPPLQTLEKIEYLTACVKEGIRLASAVPSRLPRIVPQNLSEPLVVDGKIVPPGTIVSMSAHTMHSSVDLWGPDARLFNPNRWLGSDAKGLDQYQVAFSKGARMCIGQNLVPVELTLILASILRKYKITFPSGFLPPRRVDNFTVELEGGLPLQVSPRA
ncbi:Cytochrome P450 monooxygenase sdnE [Colletotrichum sp. SAR 10_70]|nr:Cytochrome P450 monooxygenase sdnE [Colletotrichum sp. SAR 10_71]KAI8172437.1 Cytochrome P450 monooxygenase sdnE [Colletotrichum sp. SAR 10_65]KAI8187858.1 Cytochrome P450 monooxygenase sdnE [Colletotrichum sp. SAR 10_70]KAI8209585.1 Cytochrome P450 monooxygenase sdnE [Colletotrichum sp. SAR 10_76]KAI8242010.1 Cytochrome P450 monooxygenase sdnE [Colletotrichum sp. SAR 10_77]